MSGPLHMLFPMPCYSFSKCFWNAYYVLGTGSWDISVYKVDKEPCPCSAYINSMSLVPSVQLSPYQRDFPDHMTYDSNPIIPYSFILIYFP